MTIDPGMDFENTMRLAFGEKAYQTASLAANPTDRKHWLQALVKKLLKETDSEMVDAPHRAKEVLTGSLEQVLDNLKKLKKKDPPSWGLVYALFRLVLRLYGYRSDAIRCYSLSYWQTPGQLEYDEHLAGKNIDWPLPKKNNVLSIRRELIKELEQKGLDTFKIALALNTTEYEIKKLRRLP